MSELFGLKLDKISETVLPKIHTQYSLETGNILKRLDTTDSADVGDFDEIYKSSAQEFDVLYKQEKRLIEGVVKNMSESVNNIFPGVGIPKINKTQANITPQTSINTKIPHFSIGKDYVENILRRIIIFSGTLFQS